MVATLSGRNSSNSARIQLWERAFEVRGSALHVDSANPLAEELAQYVRGLAERHPVLRMRCGKGIQLRRYWLDIDYPPVPPPEYERSG